LQQLPLSIRHPHNRGHLVGEDPRQRRQVAGIVAGDAEGFPHRGLSAEGAIKIAHARPLGLGFLKAA
jgi:hypothetical protein